MLRRSGETLAETALPNHGKSECSRFLQKKIDFSC